MLFQMTDCEEAIRLYITAAPNIDSKTPDTTGFYVQ